MMTGLFAITAAMIAWGAFRFSVFSIGRTKRGEVSQDLLNNLEIDVPLHVPEAAAWVRRKSGGELMALDDRCPHLGCRQKWNPETRLFECPCHGSRFDIDGNLKTGPATKAIPGLVVDKRDKGNIRLVDQL